MDGTDAPPRPRRWTPDQVRAEAAALGPWFHNLRLMGVATAPERPAQGGDSA